jgi:hypothetical protein
MASPEQPPNGISPAVAKDRKTIRRVNGAIQFLGMLVFINEAVIRSWTGADVRTNVLAVCALAIMGSEAAKDLLLRLFDRALGHGAE